jgi:hypothetical protein
MALKFYAKKSEFCRSTEGTRAFVVKGNRGNNFLRAIFTTEKDCRGKIDWVLYVPQTEKKNSVVKIYAIPEVFVCDGSLFFMKVQNYGYIGT